MKENLLEITTKQLLKKFGAGDHKPGSGSAAALEGMLSAQLLITVISLTKSEKRKLHYKEVLPKLEHIENEIQNRIFQELVDIFHLDADQFHKTIVAREERDAENNPVKKNIHKRKALEELKISTEIPLKIAELCIELAQMGVFVFDNAFKAARGDSHVAINGAISALAGCLSIIRLNILPYGADEYEWVSKIIVQTKKLKETYEKLNSIAQSKIEDLESEFEVKEPLFKDVNSFLNIVKSKPTFSYSEIEEIATQLHRLIWKNRNIIWKEVPDHPLDTLQPSIIFKKVLGYSYSGTDKLDTIEDENGIFETAGIIDQTNKMVLVSSSFSPETQVFTAAHELGHAILHKQTVMHRDRPIDGGESKTKRVPEEIEADKFAAFFLMPKKQVIEVFKAYFGVSKFKITQDSAINLNRASVSRGAQKALRDECKNLHGLCVKLAKADFYGVNSFRSLADFFGVSIKAMAIRLEELELVEFDI